MPHSFDARDANGVRDFIDDPIMADLYPPVMLAPGQLFRACGREIRVSPEMLSMTRS
jgi:hypothetical protein